MIDRLIQLYAHTPEHPAKLRLFEILCRVFKRGRPLALTVAGGLRLRLYPFDHVDRALILTDWHERITTEFLRRNLRPGETALIAGAHMGYHVLNVARAVGPSGRVAACEPVPRSLARAIEHVRSNGCADRVRLIGRALGSAPGCAPMPEPPPENTGGAHLGAADQQRNELVHAPVDTIATTVAQLGLERLDFLLLDVEGHEGRALAGLGALRPRLMVLECDPRLLAESGEPPDEFFARLHALDYRLHTLGGADVTRPDYYPEGNIVAVRSDQPAPVWA